jgi:serine/threonine-protein kinase
MRRRLLGDRHPDVGLSINNLAATLYWLGEYERAVPLLREALGIWLEAYGEQASVTATVRHNLGQSLLDGGDAAAARPELERALAIREARNRPDDPEVALTRTTLGQALCELGEAARGEAMIRDGIDVQRRVLAPDSAWRVDFSELRLARCLGLGGREAEFREVVGANLPAIRERLGPDHPFLRSFVSIEPPS